MAKRRREDESAHGKAKTELTLCVCVMPTAELHIQERVVQCSVDISIDYHCSSAS